IFESLMGPALRVEFAAPDGSSSSGFISSAGFYRSLRADLEEYLGDEAIRRKDSPPTLLRVISSPSRLFDFRALAVVFATEVAPSQLGRSEPYFFAPARLSVFGIP